MTKNNGVYRYYNRRPDGAHLEDCVCRAISTATGLKYSAVDKLLDLIAETHECDKLVVGCYAHLLSDVFGYEQYFPRDEITVEELVREYPDKRLIIRVRGHLTSSIFGTLLDIWNCKDEVVDCFWIVE